MALQGDLESFALPDVLRLLASTSKSGRLVIEGPESSGHVDLREGRLIGGSTTAASRASDPADVVYELLRLGSGSFDFDDSAEPAQGSGSSVDEVLAAAERLVADWADVKQVVPSVDAWVTLCPELGTDEISVTSAQWRSVAALGSGTSVRALGDQFDVTDLAASQQVRELIDAGLAQISGDVPDVVVAAPAVEADEEPADDLALLAAEDGPVVLETRDDALLPEPLPGEGTSFAGDLDELASVDGRAFEPIEPSSSDGSGVPLVEEVPASEIAAPVAQEAAVDSAPADVEPGSDDDDIWASGEPVDSEGQPISEETWVAAGWDGSPPVDHLSEAEASKEGKADQGDGSDDEGDRGSLMKFLSSVKN